MNKEAEKIKKSQYPYEIFSGKPHLIKSEYAALAKKCHPDLRSSLNPVEKAISNDIMAKLNVLYQRGLEMLKNGTWEHKELLKVTDLEGRAHLIGYYSYHDFELGKMYIGDSHITYLIHETHRDLYENAIKIIGKFGFKDEKMKNEFMKSLPLLIDKFETGDNLLGLVLAKSPDQFLLADVLAYYAGEIPQRHAAWIISSILNLACYLEFACISHNAILTSNYFISPSKHSGALLGGWWYAVPHGRPLIGIPEKTYSILPPKVLDTKCGDVTTDLELLRLMGREILGDKNGTHLLEKKLAEKPMVEWLRSSSSEKAFLDYVKWEKVLKNSFGARLFVEMNITKEQLGNCKFSC